METLVRKSDAALIAALIILALVLYSVFGPSETKGQAVIVKAEGAVYGEYPLNEDGEHEIKLAGGLHSNTVRIKGGEASMAYADCPDGLCLRHAPARYGGEIIVCLPNRVTIEISGGPAGYDAVTR